MLLGLLVKMWVSSCVICMVTRVVLGFTLSMFKYDGSLSSIFYVELVVKTCIRSSMFLGKGMNHEPSTNIHC